MMVLSCYDGSADAQAAIDRAGLLMTGSGAMVLVIWETLVETLTRNGTLGMGSGTVGIYDDDGTDAALQKAAIDTATDGARRATTAGLVWGSVSHAVLHHADRPVLIIPSPALAEQRHRWADHAQLTAGVT
jgi:hypothetical protein